MENQPQTPNMPANTMFIGGITPAVPRPYNRRKTILGILLSVLLAGVVFGLPLWFLWEKTNIDKRQKVAVSVLAIIVNIALTLKLS